MVGLYMNYYDWHHGSYLNTGALNGSGSAANPQTTLCAEDKDTDSVDVNPLFRSSVVDDRLVSSAYSLPPAIAGSPPYEYVAAERRSRTMSGTGLFSGAAGVGAATIHHHQHREGSVERSNLRSRGSREEPLARMFSDEKSRVAALKAFRET